MAVHPIHMAGCPGHMVQTASPEGIQWSKLVNHNKQMGSISTHIPCERALDPWYGSNDPSLLWLRPAHGHTGPHADDAGISVSYWYPTLPPTNRKYTVCSNLIFQCIMPLLTINPFLKINLKMN